MHPFEMNHVTSFVNLDDSDIFLIGNPKLSDMVITRLSTASSKCLRNPISKWNYEHQNTGRPSSQIQL